MAGIDDLITQAQAEVTAAEALPDTDTSKAEKVAAAKAKVAGLQQAKGAGYTRTEQDVNSAVQGRLPDATNSAKEEERKRIAGILGIPEGQVTDEKLQEVKAAYQGQQSEVDRERTAKESAEQRVTALEQAEQAAKKTAESAKANLVQTLKRQAVERALLAEGVVHATGTDEQGNERVSYLDGTYRLTDLSGVSVEVEVADDGSLNVKGEVQGASDAAKKTKESYPAMFGGTSTVENPRQTPAGRSGGASSEFTYAGNYNIPVTQGS